MKKDDYNPAIVQISDNSNYLSSFVMDDKTLKNEILKLFSLKPRYTTNEIQNRLKQSKTQILKVLDEFCVKIPGE